jgi:hypothetical protein
MSETAVEPDAAEVEPVAMWEGLLAKEGSPTDDRRFLMEVGHRDLPLSLMVMTITDEGHKGAQLGGRIDEIWREDKGGGVVEIWGRGPFDSSEFGQETSRLVKDEFLRGVSIDISVSESFVLDPTTYEPIDTEAVGLDELVGGDYLTGIKGTIMGATLVPFAAFEDTRVSVVTASAMRIVESEERAILNLVAAGGLEKPPRDAFDDPNLAQLTPLTIRGRRVFGHLADWTGCHTGFSNICVPPFRSDSDFAYFNVGEIETEEGDFVPVGKLMFSMDKDVGHADARPGVLDAQAAAKYYDKATNVGAYVRAGSDRHGIYLAGWLRDGLTDLEIQHLRANPPSGDWRPIPGKGNSELVAAFSVPVPGFPIQRALVASAGADALTIITGPLQVEKPGPRALRRQMGMLRARRCELQALGADPTE